MTWTRRVSRNDVKIHLRHPATHCARVVQERSARRGRGECRVPVAPAVSCAKVESTRGSRHESAGTPGIPARDGFNSLFRALPGDRAFLSPSSPRSLLLKNLTPASRRQDHTTSPSASAPFVRAKCLRCVLPHPSHPCPTFVTIAKRPSVRAGMARDIKLIWVRREAVFRIFRNKLPRSFSEALATSELKARFWLV
jgi:hypothetical protein